jgi:hypothetical protein
MRLASTPVRASSISVASRSSCASLMRVAASRAAQSSAWRRNSWSWKKSVAEVGGDEIAALRHRQQQILLRQPLQRLAQRRASDRQPLHAFLLVDRRARQQFRLDDGGAQPVIGDVAQAHFLRGERLQGLALHKYIFKISSEYLLSTTSLKDRENGKRPLHRVATDGRHGAL